MSVVETLTAVAVLAALLAIVSRAWYVISSSDKREQATHDKIDKGDKRNATEIEKLEYEFKEETGKLWVEVNKLKDRILDIYKNQ